MDRLPITGVAAPEGAPPAGAYSPALVWNGLVFVSGQGPLDPKGNIMSGTIEEETELTLRNIQAQLRAAGTDLDRVVKCTCYLADIKDFGRFNAAYKAVFGEAGHLPTRTTVEAGLLGIKVEIDAIATL